MNNNKKKQPAKKVAKKRQYNRKPKGQTVTNIDSTDVEFLKPTAKKDTELEQLTAICSMMDNFSPDTKQRVLKFICGRYYDFL